MRCRVGDGLSREVIWGSHQEDQGEKKSPQEALLRLSECFSSQHRIPPLSELVAMFILLFYPRSSVRARFIQLLGD